VLEIDFETNQKIALTVLGALRRRFSPAIPNSGLTAGQALWKTDSCAAF